MRIERTQDVALIKSVLTHPSIYPFISDDGSPSAEEFDPSGLAQHPMVYFLAAVTETGVGAVWMLHAINSFTYEVHTCVLPEFRGQTTEAAKAVAVWMFENTNCKKIITHVPSYNRLALKLAERVGMEHEGVNRKSWFKDGLVYDQYVLGLCKE